MQWRIQLTLAAVGLSLGCLAQAAPATANTATSAGHARPKICLVLSGGGARGAAHVGVLKVLEEYRVPVDCIAGTSMGALVGAAYATGMTVPEMQDILKQINSELLFKEKPPRRELSMRRKRDDYGILFTPDIGIGKGKALFGKGVVSGVQLETVLRRLSKTKGQYHFDDLPIPYRAVATNLVTGKEVVFDEGDLAQVMRASMSVPGAVAPAELDGMLLVDGMLTSNLPVQTAREQLGADIVIAVNVGTPLLTREQLGNFLGITEQMLNILTEQNVQASLATLNPEDILISPELDRYSNGDFDLLTEIAPKGEIAARRVADRLAALSLPAAEYAALRERQQVVVSADLRPVDEIRVQPLKRVNPQVVEAAMHTKAHQPIQQETLDRDMRRIYGTDNFEHVSYRFLDESDRRILAVNAVEKSWGPNYLRFGLGLASDFSGDSFFNLRGSYRRTWLNERGGEWRTDVQFGHTNGLYTEFYQPFSAAGPLFIAPHAEIEQRNYDLYQNDNHVATYEVVSSLAGVDLGSQLDRYGELRLGVLGGRLKPDLEIGTELLSPGEGHVTQGAFQAELRLDQLDSVHFPRAGWYTFINLFDANDALGADDDYSRWDTSGGLAYSFGNHTLNFSFKLGDSFGGDRLPRYDQFRWGGFLTGSGYSPNQLIGEELRFGRVMYYHRILQGSILEGAYGGLSLEATKIGKPLVPGNSEDWLPSASAFVAADSPLGPVYLGYGRAEDGNWSFYFFMGRPF